MTVLTAWDSTTRLIALYAATGCLKDEQSQSVLLISPPGQGKTEMIKRFAHLPSVNLLTDLTQMGIRSTIEGDVQRKIRHIAITEMDRIFARDKGTRGPALGLLTNLMTGDVGKEKIGPHEFDFTGRQVGVIAAMTTEQFKSNKLEMAASGMLSRFEVIATDRTSAERDRVIRNMVFQVARDKSPIPWAALYSRATVKYDTLIAEKVHDFLRSHPKLPQDERFVGRFLILLKATAWLNGRITVTEYDLEVLKLFLPYFTYEQYVQLDWPFHYSANNKR